MKMLPSDADLLIGLREGREASFGKIYERHSARLIDFVAGKLPSLEDARDIVHDIFVSLWTNRATAEIKSLPEYLYGAARFKIIDHIRRHIQQDSYSAQTRLLEPVSDNSTLEGILYRDMNGFLDSEIKKLPPRMQEVFVLSRKRSLSIREISSELNISEQTVKNQLSSAVKALRPLRNKIRQFLFGFLA